VWSNFYLILPKSNIIINNNQHHEDVNTLRKLIREGQTELAEIGTSSTDQLAPISSLLDVGQMHRGMFPFSPSLNRSYFQYAQPSVAQLELQKRHVAPILPSSSVQTTLQNPPKPNNGNDPIVL
jgi:hypothetical protein